MPLPSLRCWSVFVVGLGFGCADTSSMSPDATSTGDASTGTAVTTSSGSSVAATGASDESGALQEPLTLDAIQALGTHNSYHIATSPLQVWDYTHRPLDEQLELGVRQFELDLYRDADTDEFFVLHVEGLDEGTNCATLAVCLESLHTWSQAHPMHHPIVVLLEPKDTVTAGQADAWLEALETSVTAGWPMERAVVPSMLIRDHESLRAGLEAEGWPLLDDLRGTALFILHDAGTLRDALVASELSARTLFPDAMGDATADYAAFHSINDPIGDADAIQAVVTAGHLVRTRADADNVEPNAGDVTRRDAALASGAHFISTDYPEPAPSGYVVTIPDGTPSRCNPLRAPAGCTAQHIEDPAALGQ